MSGPQLAIKFLGVGNAFAHELGNSSCVLERNDAPLLMVDCGPLSLSAFDGHYRDAWPRNLFITHLHMDHVGGLEGLFFRLFLARLESPGTRLFVPTHLVHALHQKLANTTHAVSEGGVNWWDVFQLIPVGDTFWLEGLLFRVFPVRHFAHLSAFGLCLPGSFLYTADTRPIPEILTTYANDNEVIFHDADLEGSPAHSGIDELLATYTPEQIARLRIYHYASDEAGQRIATRGATIVRPGETIPLSPPRGGAVNPEPILV